MVFLIVGEPNNSGGENCLHIYTSRRGWNDLPCNRGLAYVCEIHCKSNSFFLQKMLNEIHISTLKHKIEGNSKKTHNGLL